MKVLSSLLIIYFAHVSLAGAAANCQHSSSWQCRGHQSNSGQLSQTGGGVSTGGITPDKGQTNTHLGTLATNTVPMMTLTPATQTTPMVPLTPAQPIQPPQVPPQQPTAVPNQVPPQVPPKQPMAIPNKVPPQQVTPIQSPSFTGYGKQPPKQVVMVPPKVFTGQSAVPPKPVITAPPKVPPVQVYAIPPKTFTGRGPVPQPQPQMVPPKPQPQMVPPKPQQVPLKVPPRQVYPNPNPIVVGYGQVPPRQVAPQPQPTITGQGQVPPVQVTPKPPQVITGQGQVPPKKPAGVKPPTQPGVVIEPPTQPVDQVNVTVATTQPAVTGPTHFLVNNNAGPLRIGEQLSKTDFGKEVVEPGTMNSRVELYRSNDYQEVAFKDTIPMDATGFHFTVVGIKEPVFTKRSDVLPDAGDESFVFFFDYASAEVHPEQVGLYEEIVTEYKKTGKRLIVMGETDGYGSNEYNTALATHRSSIIIDELQERGIAEGDIEMRLLVRYGNTDPSTDEAHRLSSVDRITWVHFE